MQSRAGRKKKTQKLVKFFLQTCLPFKFSYWAEMQHGGLEGIGSGFNWFTLEQAVETLSKTHRPRALCVSYVAH